MENLNCILIVYTTHLSGQFHTCKRNLIYWDQVFLFKEKTNSIFFCSEPAFNLSAILSGNISYDQQLTQWIGGNWTAKLCWRATRDGWAVSTFHSNCDDKAPTVTIVKVGDYIFGGYATATWTGKITILAMSHTVI